MPTYNYKEFVEQVLLKYFPIVNYDNLPDKIKTFFENRSRAYIYQEFYIEKNAINICEVNSFEFITKFKMKFPFLNKISNLKIYLFEYTKSYHRGKKNDFATTELITDLCIFDTETEKVISYIECRENVDNFRVSFKEAFIGFINTEREYQNLGIGTFMLRVISSYVWWRRRIAFNSDTCMSDQFVCLCRSLDKKKNIVVREDYYSNARKKEIERYRILPYKLNIKVMDSNEEFKF